MKRLIAVWVMILCLMPVDGWAEEETSEPLFPAMEENGKWGYINQSGEFVIAPQFDYATEFRGNYAVVTIYPDGFTPSEDMNWTERPDCEGVIDYSGELVLEATYSFDPGYDESYYGGKDTGIWYVTRWGEDEDNERVGFFDIQSGCFSGLKWKSIWPWVSDSRLIPVMDDTYRAGYADRVTGELVIPCLFFSTDPSVFREGVAPVAYEDEAGDASEFFLIDETGATIPLPEGIHAVYGHGASGGRIAITDDEKLLGFADLQGHVVIEPQFTYVGSFSEGFAEVQFPAQDWGIIDREGTILTRGIIAQHWSGPHFDNGYRTEKTGTNTYSLLDMYGETVFSLTINHIVSLDPPLGNGLCWFAVDEEGDETHWHERRYGLVNLQGDIITDAKWIKPDFSSYSEGYHIVAQMIDGQRKLGYLNNNGSLSIPCIFDDATGFENGLAYVRIGRRCGYIDKNGQEVYFWEFEEEPDSDASDEEE